MSHPSTCFPAELGLYILILRLSAPARIVVGRLGAFDFAPGWYAYVGSACGPGGLRGRLAHHLSPVRKPHWHIDFLRPATVIQEIWYATEEHDLEHTWASALYQMPGAEIAASRFGASDCRCASHLIYSACGFDVKAFHTPEGEGPFVILFTTLPT